ncbi:MAG: DUF86 domain-containing protein [Chitinophagales bacterium]|nr:DUF86 domain-containing protein [Chitinophagales bacterium]
MNSKNTRSDALYLEDMIHAIEKVLNYTKGFDFAQFESNEVVKDAVLLNLQIVGEGANKISKATKQKHPNIPWRDMADFRIIIAHIYFAVSDDKIWELITHHLPNNLTDLKKVLAETEK